MKVIWFQEKRKKLKTIKTTIDQNSTDLKGFIVIASK